jgi:hypothetical protein
MFFIADALKHPNNKVTILSLGLNNVGPEGMLHLSKAFMNENNKVESLCIGYNGLGPRGARHMANALEHEHNKLKELIMNSNRLGRDGVIALAEALAHPNCKLLSLNVCYNGLDLEGLKVLVRSSKLSCLRNLLAYDDQRILSDRSQHQLDKFCQALNSKWFRAMLAILSIFSVPRLCRTCDLSDVPLILLQRAFYETLGWPINDLEIDEEEIFSAKANNPDERLIGESAK